MAQMVSSARMRPAGVVLALLIALHQPPVLGQDQPQAQTVYMPGRDSTGVVITPPRLLREVKNRYTVEAMRHGVEGTVWVQAVVLPDGTVGDVTVTKSLDRRYGLDDEALIAVKQWRFRPGTRLGIPVPVRVTIELTFTLKNTPPTRSWPRDFAGEPVPDAVVESVESPRLRVSVTRPAGWAVRRDASPDEWLAMQSPDGTHTLILLRDQPAPFRLSWPVAPNLVETLVENARRVEGAERAQTVARGQATSPKKVFWVWSEIEVYASDLPSANGAAAPADSEARAWFFITTVHGQAVIVRCHLAIPDGLPVADRDARIQRAATEFSAVIYSIDVNRK